jgi:hypothetical protein
MTWPRCRRFCDGPHEGAITALAARLLALLDHPKLLTRLIAAISSHDARFSIRCVRSGTLSPASSAFVYPFRDAKSPASADTYLPACAHVRAAPLTARDPARSSTPSKSGPDWRLAR